MAHGVNARHGPVPAGRDPLPIWRRRQVLGFLKSLTGPNAAALEKIIKQWAQETDRDLDLLGGGG